MIFFIPIIVGCLAQATKFFLSTIKHKKIEPKHLLDPGHMPSAHTAFVISLATTVAYFDGVFSTTFAVSVVLAYLVIYDALNIRTNIGRNGRATNKLIREVPGIKKESYPILRETVGHKLSEVVAGGFLGFILTVMILVL